MPTARRADGPATIVQEFSSMAEPRPNTTVVSKRRASVTFEVYGAILTSAAKHSLVSTKNLNTGVVVPAANQTRGMVETSLEAVALCGASLLSDAFAPVPSPSERGFLNSSPQAEPSVQISRTGLPR